MPSSGLLQLTTPILVASCTLELVGKSRHLLERVFQVPREPGTYAKGGCPLDASAELQFDNQLGSFLCI